MLINIAGTNQAFRGLRMTTCLKCGMQMEYMKQFYMFNTSQLFTHPERALKGLSDWTGLEFPIEKIKEILFDADSKYYEN